MGAQYEAALDVDEVLEMARPMLGDLAQSWNRGTTAEKARLRRLVMPDGVWFDVSLVGTANLSPVFEWLSNVRDPQSSSVGPAVPSLNQRRAFLAQVRDIYEVAA